MYATKLKKATYYKYIVKANKMVDGKQVITGTSVAVHSITKDGKYGVAKAVSIIKNGKKKNDTEVTLKKGKTAQITAGRKYPHQVLQSSLQTLCQCMHVYHLHSMRLIS